MNRNYIKHPLYITSTVTVLLLSLYFVPEKIINKLDVRKIDILSDVRRDTVSYEDVRTFVLLPAMPETKEISCPSGMVCFEDYSEEKDGMHKFFKALDSKSGKPVRIAFLGDSYVEGDIFSGDLRANLQNEYGGRGVGMALPASHVSSFRKTVKHSFSGWNTYSIIDSKDFSKMGISGYYFTPGENAQVKYSGVDMPHLNYFNQVSLLYSLSDSTASVSYRINDEKEIKTVTLEPSSKITKCDIVTDSIENIQMNFSPQKNLYVYGFLLQDTSGVVVDNFSLRGTPGTTLKYLSEDVLKQMNEILDYDLIILQYGLNVMTANNTHYTSYQKGMQETVEHIKKCFPGADILLLSVGDRSMNKQGEYVTMPGAIAMVKYQQAICAETGIVFWNLFEAMGGSGSMVEMVKATPPKANKDYTHLNFEGGKFLGEILFKTFLFEKKRYDKTGKIRKKNKEIKDATPLNEL
jgi:hypothetical protein